MLLERLIAYLSVTATFRYSIAGNCLEVWLSGSEQLPIVVGTIKRERYIISSGNLSYETRDEERAYRYILRICSAMAVSSAGR